MIIARCWPTDVIQHDAPALELKFSDDSLSHMRVSHMQMAMQAREQLAAEQSAVFLDEKLLMSAAIAVSLLWLLRCKGSQLVFE